MKLLTVPKLYLLLMVFSLMMLTASLAMQFFLQLAPCSLCLLARVDVGLLCLTFIVAWLHQPKAYAKVIYLLIAYVLIISGLLITGRHVWILHLPPDLVPACAPDFSYLLKNFPAKEIFLTLLQSSGECRESNNSFLQLSLPTWTFLAFSVLFCGNSLLAWRHYQSKAKDLM